MANENKVPHAKKSPRNTEGIIYWYEGDTFPLRLSVNLINDAGEHVSFSSGDKLDVVFYSERREKEVLTVHFDDIVSGSVTVDVNEELTAFFPTGRYVYDVVYRGAYRRTIAKNNRIVVE